MSSEMQSGETVSEWAPIDLAVLDWWPIVTYSSKATRLPIVQDADNKTWLAQLDRKGVWREFIDGELTQQLVPVRWAVPTSEMVQALAFG